MKISLLGTGWLGSSLFATLLKSDRYALFASYRSPDTRKKLQVILNRNVNYQKPARPDGVGRGSSVIEAMQADAPGHQLILIDVPDFTDRDLPFFSANTLIMTLPPGRRREEVLDLYTSEISAIIKRAEANGVRHLIYTSSTGVYGNTEGLVDEETPVAPATNSARAIVAAENLLRSSKIPTTILRLAGLYGPGRHPGRWFAGKEQLTNSEAPINLVHQQDVVVAIEKVIASGPPLDGHDIYNVCSAAHPTRAEFYGKAIQAYGGSLPKMLAGGACGKRIDSSKIRHKLDWHPHHYMY